LGVAPRPFQRAFSADHGNIEYVSASLPVYEQFELGLEMKDPTAAKDLPGRTA
jgi:hypothetical protein